MLKFKIDKEKDQGVQHYGGKKSIQRKYFLKSIFWVYNFCAELRVWWKCCIFLHLIVPPNLIENYHNFVFFGYKVTIQPHFKSRLFWKTKYQEAENLRKSYICTLSYPTLKQNSFRLVPQTLASKCPKGRTMEHCFKASQTHTRSAP